MAWQPKNDVESSRQHAAGRRAAWRVPPGLRVLPPLQKESGPHCHEEREDDGARSAVVSSLEGHIKPADEAHEGCVHQPPGVQAQPHKVEAKLLAEVVTNVLKGLILRPFHTGQVGCLAREPGGRERGWACAVTLHRTVRAHKGRASRNSAASCTKLVSSVACYLEREGAISSSVRSRSGIHAVGSWRR